MSRSRRARFIKPIRQHHIIQSATWYPSGNRILLVQHEWKTNPGENAVVTGTVLTCQ
ncbi:hypothetical protein U1Q18_052220, partial [Sarracenia purpurea var. burkii]